MAQLTGYAASLTGGPLNAQLIIPEKSKDGKNKKTASGTPTVGQKSTKAQKIIEANKDRLAVKKALKAPASTKPVHPNSIQHKSVESILEHDGPHLDRSMGAKEDPRVPFTPDAWQIKVLDELDIGNSLLVVASTSAGKTFCSFYAMSKVLRANDDDVLVYVAPTKALVNQIGAEIMARYKKNYRSGSGKSCISIYTRDYRVNKPTKAQILVTVPHMLSILMMSPTNRDWVPRIKTIIFDEVHSISQAEDGLIWEQLIMSAPCQIIALSATVGNVEAFSNWLSFARAGSGPKLTLIEHSQRFSELRKHVYVPVNDRVNLSDGLPKIETKSPLGLGHIENMRQIHPIASITRPERGLPADLSLESHDCLALWKVLQEHKTTRHSVPHDLDPDRFFRIDKMVKADVVRWGQALKSVLARWMSDPDSPAKDVLRVLSSNLYDGTGDADIEQMASHRPKQFLCANMGLLCDLRANNALPAILFNYNRKECEDMARDLLVQLEQAEEEYKATNNEWKATLAKYRRWKQAQNLHRSQCCARVACLLAWPCACWLGRAKAF